VVDLNSANREYIERLYEQYCQDPGSLEAEWVAFFKGFDFGLLKSDEEEEERAKGPATDPSSLREQAGTPAVAAPRSESPETVQVEAAPTAVAPVAVTPAVGASAAGASAPEAGFGGPNRRRRERTDKGVVAVVRAYRHRGHLIARLDPLGHDETTHPLLELAEFGLTEEDLEKGVGFGGFHYKTDGSLKALLAVLRSTYCGSLGMDTMSTADKSQETWLEERIEPVLNRRTFSTEQKHRILWQLIETQEFEQFLHTRYIGQKRFSIEGCEALLPLVDALVVSGSEMGVEEMVIGMSHRGRLNVLAHILHKPYEVILADFEGAGRGIGAEDEGDVKYHQGYSHDFVTGSGRKMHLSLSPNPSHLELVNPVIEGMVQAKQDHLHDVGRSRVVPIQIHGEAAFTGQGIVAETLNLSQLEGYKNGGTIHIIVNNQLAYTALPRETRFTRYPTDVSRQIQAPVFHVNADDPEAVVHAAQLAVEFRTEFKRDVLIDLVGYRRYGHNEADDPTLTQPVMYREIADHRTAVELYAEALIATGDVTSQDIEEMQTEVRETLERSQEKARRLKVRPRPNTFGGVWQGATAAGSDWEADTGVSLRVLKRIAERATTAPDDFSLHRTVQRVMKARREMVEGNRPVDWGCGEMLAYGSLLLERIPVRLTGQDVQRGTFAHRHAVWHDTESGDTYVPLDHLSKGQSRFEVFNSMLSELAVLGFEYGISSADPGRLIMWEAQFGDFANGAQLIIDQYISSAEAKWKRMSAIVLLLPHGYEGMGPEHSSARLERYLQLCAKDNMQVCYPTTPAQIFHVLRRQMHRTFRKPLIVMTPKSLLRHKRCVADIGDFVKGGYLNVIDDVTAQDPEKVRRVVLCTGKVYYDLLAGREEIGMEGVALVRVEQLYPLPEKELRGIVERYVEAEEFLWVQEEALNMGAWYFVQPLVDEILPTSMRLRYVGRDEAASPAVGDHQAHISEQQEIVKEALDLHSRELVLEDVKTRSASGREY